MTYEKTGLYLVDSKSEDICVSVMVKDTQVSCTKERNLIVYGQSWLDRGLIIRDEYSLKNYLVPLEFLSLKYKEYKRT